MSECSACPPVAPGSGQLGWKEHQPGFREHVALILALIVVGPCTSLGLSFPNCKVEEAALQDSLCF